MTGPRPLAGAAEAALLGVTISVVLGMGRLFDGGGWAGPMLANAVAAHVVVTLLRRRGLSLIAAGALLAVAAAVVATWASYWHTTAAGLPTGNTWSAMQLDLEEAWLRYQDVSAPAPVARGFVLASCLALWLVAYIADWAAFRLWVPFEATLPAGTLFLFTSLTALLCTSSGRGWAVALYATAVIGFLLVHRLARQEGSSHWVAERRTAGTRSLLMAGAGLGLVAVLVGVVFGPAVPGAESRGVLDPRSLRGDDARFTISPLVDIRSRLVDQAAVEVFTVQSSERAYWRLTSLERFDGSIWSSSGGFGTAEGELPESVETDVDRVTFEQTYSIKALTAIWLPAAYEPRALRSPGVSVRYHEDSATLIVDNDVDNSNGLGYRVSSSSPRISPEDLQSGGDVPGDIRDTYLDLPDGFSDRVRNLAREVTAGASTPAEQARALQDHLRTFRYSLEVQKGHSEDALEDFLFTTRVGYCEQFAGAFAAMARSIGLPARVAVGFTPGEEVEGTPGLYSVRGEYAHAWPEVYIAGAGWVLYEPTPGRGAPNAESYTGVPEAQAAASDPGGSETPNTTATTAPIPGGTDGPGTTVDPFNPEGELDTSGGGASFDAEQPDPVIERYVLTPVARAAPAVGGTVLAYLLLFPAGLLLRRAVRRRRATTAAGKIALAWQEAAEGAGVAGYEERPSDTYVERATRLAGVVPDAAPAAFTLARCLQEATFSAEGADEDGAQTALDASRDVAAAVRGAIPLPQRVLRWFDPRTLLGDWRRGHTARQRRITLTARGDLEQERELVGSGDRG